MNTKNHQSGFILPMVLILMVVLMALGTALMLMTTTNVEQAGNSRTNQATTNYAYDLYQRGLLAIETNSCEFGGTEQLDTDGDTFIDGDDAVNGNWVECEVHADKNGDGVVDNKDESQRFGTGKLKIFGTLKSCANSNAERDHYTIKASSEIGGTRQTIEAKVEHKSYLYYARFCESSVSYGAGAFITGEIYSGGNLNVSNYDTFLKDVTLKGTLQGEGSEQTATTGRKWDNCEIRGTLTENYEKTLSMDIANQVADFFEDAASCGWMIDAAHGKYCLGNSQDGGTDNLLDLTYLKNLRTGTPVYDNGSNCTGASAYALPANFNGVIAWSDSNSGSIHVKGTLGVDGEGMGVSVFSHGDIYIDDDITTTPTEPDKLPVNVGLVADGNNAEIRISELAPIWLTINAAVMSSRSNWVAEGSANTATLDAANAANPPRFSGSTMDMDGNGTLDTENKWGYDETNLDPQRTVLLQFIGPIITKTGGSAGKYHYNGSIYSTRDYGYDPDILAYPPPFPKIKNLLHMISYNETEEPL